MRAAALGVLLLCGCAPVCPDNPPLCQVVVDGGCEVFAARCCQGVVVCPKSTSFTDDAGSCTPVSPPALQCP